MAITAGIVDTRSNFTAGVVDTGSKFSVGATLYQLRSRGKVLPPVSLIRVINFAAGVNDTGGKFATSCINDARNAT